MVYRAKMAARAKALPGTGLHAAQGAVPLARAGGMTEDMMGLRDDMVRKTQRGRRA
jgi:hypothetical protein